VVRGSNVRENRVFDREARAWLENICSPDQRGRTPAER
jgi:hypothetical protein